MFTEASTYKDMAAKKPEKPDEKKKKKQPKLFWLGHMLFLICHFWEILSSPKVQNIARITVIQISYFETHRMKNIQQIHRDPTVIKYCQIFSQMVYIPLADDVCRHYKNI